MTRVCLRLLLSRVDIERCLLACSVVAAFVTSVVAAVVFLCKPRVACSVVVVVAGVAVAAVVFLCKPRVETERCLLACSVVAAVVVVVVVVAAVVVFLCKPRVETERCLLAWRLRWSEREKARLQWLQRKGLTPVCFL